MQSRTRHVPKSGSGFTLVEMLVTLAIIAGLVTIGLPTFASYYKVARKVECQSSITYFCRAQDLYYLDNQKFYQKQPGDLWSEDIGWAAASRPDQVDKYRFEELGVTLARNRYWGYRLRIYKIDDWGWLFWHELRLYLTTDENFDPQKPDPELFMYRKYNWQTTWGAGTNGKWIVSNDFWFDVPTIFQ
jgi:prepilin-type N-terminal cleavage/methylation domain-containing protein